jgi:hypothetical protein
MALSFSGISSYKKELIAPLLTEAVFSAKTQSLIKSGGILLPKTKSSVAVPKLATNATFQADGCGWNASGTTTLSQATVTVGKIKLEEAICVKDFEAYFSQESLKAGSTPEDMGWAEFADKFASQKNKMIAKQLETAIWQGDTTGTNTNTNTNKFDGLIKLIDAGSPVDANVTGFTGATGTIATITAANVVSCLQAVYKAIPVEIVDAEDTHIFVGNDVYRLAVLAYQALDLFNYKLDANADQMFVIPGTNVKLAAVNGLNGTGDIYATTLSNIALAFDLEAEEDNYSLWYSKDNNEMRYRVAFKLGVNVAYTTLCVKFKSAI